MVEVVLTMREGDLLEEAADMLLDTWEHGSAEDYDMDEDEFAAQISELVELLGKVRVATNIILQLELDTSPSAW